MAKKKTITLECDIKKTNQNLLDVIEALSVYGIVDMNDIDQHNLKKLAETAEEFLELYENESSILDDVDGLDEVEE